VYCSTTATGYILAVNNKNNNNNKNVRDWCEENKTGPKRKFDRRNWIVNSPTQVD
jgi:hypothetical protein